MSGHLLAVSERPEDLEFCQKTAKAAGLEFHHANTAAQVESVLSDNKNTITFWDVDHANALQARHPMSVQAVGQTLLGFNSPEKVIAVSGKPLNATPHLFNMPAFGHHLFRQYQAPCPEIIAQIARGVFNPSPFGVGQYLPPNTAVQKITIKRSKERKVAAEAINSVFGKRGIPQQLVGLVAQAADELLMNAIFDAPVKGESEFYRREEDRAGDFALNEKEIVTLEIGSAPEYIALCVSDQFGSLKKESVLGYIRKDYETQQYKIREGDPGAGLGIYGILQSGLSLLFISKPRARSEVVLFFPVVKNFKTFRTSFRFFSFIFR